MRSPNSTGQQQDSVLNKLLNNHQAFSDQLFQDAYYGKWDTVLNQLRSKATFEQICEKTKNNWNILHFAIQNIDDETKSAETVQGILGVCKSHTRSQTKMGKLINLVNNEGDTPLHIAISKLNQQVVEDLLLHGADINIFAKTNKTDTLDKLHDWLRSIFKSEKRKNSLNLENVDRKNDKTDALGKIYDRLHRILVKFYDRNFKINKGKYDPLNYQLWEVTCNFTPVTGVILEHEKDKNLRYQETRLLATALAQEGVKRSDIILHPLAQIFLYLKGEQYKYFILLSVLIHIAWSLVCYWYFSTLSIRLDSGIINHPFSRFATLTFIFLIISVAKEGFELSICPNFKYYYRQQENVGQWVVIAIVLFTLICSFFPCNEFTNGWSITGRGVALLLFQGQLTKFNRLGIYNLMLIKSFKKIVCYIIRYSPMLIALAVTFSSFLPQLPMFNFKWGAVFVKMMAMLTGELNYNEIFFPENKDDTTDISKPEKDNEFEIVHPVWMSLWFLVFIVVINILLQNLLISMTVADYDKLKQECKTSHLAARLEVIFLIERFISGNKFTRELFKLDKWISNPLTEKIINLPENIVEDIKAYDELRNK